ncbi:MAG: cobalamin biosynthesis protein [Rhodospirillales bacterium]|nr:cobalamin biosynthesis protein [Rhodospirillales bacterium]
MPRLRAMFSYGLFGGVYGFDPAVLLLSAMALDAALGGFTSAFRFLPHPEAQLRRVVSALEGKLNREKRSAVDRAIRGALVAIFGVAAAGAIGLGVAWLGRNHDFGWVVELLLIAALIDQRACQARLRGVGKALSAGSLEEARQTLQPLTHRDTARMDDHGVVRSALEIGAVNVCAGAIAPIFWYVLFGLPGMAVCRALTVMNAAIGHSSARYRAFGMTAARLNDVAQLVPVRIAGLLIALAALFAPTAKPGAAFATMMREARNYPAPGVGWPVAAVAGALGLALGGPRHYAERTTDDPWIGSGSAQAEKTHLRRGLYLFAVARLINVMLVALLALLRYGVAV